MSRIGLKSMITELAQAVQYTQLMMKKANLDSFWDYFKEQDMGMDVITKDIFMQYSENGEIKCSKLMVPVACLVCHNELTLDKVEVTIKANITAENEGIQAELGPYGRQDTGENGEKGNDGSQCEIKLQFDNKEPSEGIREVINMLNKMI